MKSVFYTLFYLSSLLMVTGMIAACDSTTADMNKTCVDTLQKATTTANSFFIKVHAGEALVLNGYMEGIESTFVQLRADNPNNATGATRVLARLYRQTDTARYNECINKIIDQYLHADSMHPRLVAVESLGKLGYSNTLPEILRDAQTGEGGFRAMARWVLANGGTQAGEDSLAALLAYPDAVDYRSAAYALRFKASVGHPTYQLLEQCVNRLSLTDPARIYVLSALFVHTPAATQETVKAKLLEYKNGVVAAKYEMAEALSLKGAANDLPVLETLLNDADNDVRVAAANAILKIRKRRL